MFMYCMSMLSNEYVVSFMVEYRESKIKEIHGTKVLVELLEPPLQPNKVPVVIASKDVKKSLK